MHPAILYSRKCMIEPEKAELKNENPYRRMRNGG